MSEADSNRTENGGSISHRRSWKLDLDLSAGGRLERFDVALATEPRKPSFHRCGRPRNVSRRITHQTQTGAGEGANVRFWHITGPTIGLGCNPRAWTCHLSRRDRISGRTGWTTSSRRDLFQLYREMMLTDESGSARLPCIAFPC